MFQDLTVNPTWEKLIHPNGKFALLTYNEGSFAMGNCVQHPIRAFFSRHQVGFI
jgi:hypothetical protein